MFNVIDRDLFCCPICCNEFNLGDFTPLCISCGHTICRDCVSRMSSFNTITCPIDKKKITLCVGNSPIKNQFDNNIIIQLLRLIDSSYIDVKQLTKYSFYFCRSCNLFISNLVIKVHVTAGHRVVTFKQYIKDFDYLNKLVEKENCSDHQLYLINMSVVLQYFHNPKIVSLFTIGDTKVTRNEHFFDLNYSFIGHKIKNVYFDKKSFANLSLLTKFALFDEEIKNICNNSKYCLKKGMYMSKDKIIINGIFLAEQTKEKNKPNILKRALGLFKDNETSLFFGVMDLNPNSYYGYEIKFKYGILISSNNFYFGSFNNSNTYPVFDHVYGEESDLCKKIVVRRNSNYSITLNPNSNCNTFEENEFKNKYFYLTDNILGVRKQIEENLFTVEYHSKTNIFDKEYHVDFNYIFLDFIIILNNKGEEFKINPIDSFSNVNLLKLCDTYITFLKYSEEKEDFRPSLKFINENSFAIIFSNMQTSQKYSQYLIKVRDANKEDFNFISNFFNLKSQPVKDIYQNLNSFIITLNNFLTINAENFEIQYKQLNSNKDEEYCYIIDCKEGIIKVKYPKLNKEKNINYEALKKYKIKDLLQNLLKKDLQEILKSDELKNENLNNSSSGKKEQSITNKKGEKAKNIKSKIGCKCLIF